MSEPDLVKRIQDLETRYMHLERFTEELSDVVAAQQRTIDQLSAMMVRMRQQILAIGDVKGPGDEPPPHY